jgi:MYXO-CTERM domain-containing protein
MLVKLSCLSALSVASFASGATITQWNFNGDSATTIPGGTSAPTPSVGSGTASLIGGTTGSFASGASNSGSSDPVTTNPPNFAWGTTAYPAASTGDKTAGTQYLVSTVGYEDIVVSYDLRHSNTSSRYEQVQYTTNGTTWIDAVTFDGNAGDTWFKARTFDLSAIPAADANASFGVRIVSTFAPETTGYAASSSVGTYAGTGTWRFDMVTISGTAVPEPAGLAALGLFAVAGLRRRRAV